MPVHNNNNAPTQLRGTLMKLGVLLSSVHSAFDVLDLKIKISSGIMFYCLIITLKLLLVVRVMSQTTRVDTHSCYSFVLLKLIKHNLFFMAALIQ